MKTTPKCTRTIYNRFKTHVATLVSTLVLAACTAAPVPALATSAYIPSSSFSKMCYELSGMVYTWTQIKNPEAAVERYNLATEGARSTAGNEGFNEGLERLFYFGMVKRNVYRGENLKQVLMLECPTIFREALN